MIRSKLSIILTILNTLAYISLTQISFNIDLAEVLMCYADRAYCTMNQLTTRMCSQRCTLFGVNNMTVFLNQETRISGFVGFSQPLQAIVISFKGSDSAINWNHNLEISLVDYPGCENCKIHKGMLLNWESIKDDVWAAYEYVRSLYTPVMVYITGHSLGAAIATIANHQFYLRYGFAAITYNYGCPRIANPELSLIWDGLFYSIFYRVVNYGDLAAQIPAASLGYRHTGTEVWLDKYNYNQHKICPSPNNAGENQECSIGLRLTEISAFDHKQSYYFKKLANPNDFELITRNRPDDSF